MGLPAGCSPNPTKKTGELKMFDEIWVDFLMQRQ
jgi:hypothetical protein